MGGYQHSGQSITGRNDVAQEDGPRDKGEQYKSTCKHRWEPWTAVKWEQETTGPLVYDPSFVLRT
jgi:hypothetical protein